MDCDNFVLNYEIQIIIIDLQKILNICLVSVIWMEIMNYSVTKIKKILVNSKLKLLRVFGFSNLFV